MKESLGYAVNSSDLQHEEWDCSVDKIHALGLTKGFGSDFVRFLDGLQPAAHKNLVYRLAKCQGREKKISRHMAIKLANMAIMELTLPHCVTCHGAGEMMLAELKVTCTSCKGIGVRRYSDMDRAIFLGLELSTYQKGWNNRFTDVLALLKSHYEQAIYEAKKRLTHDY